MVDDYLESFPALEPVRRWALHAFVRRIPGIDLSLSKAEVVARLAPWHEAAVSRLGFAPESLWTAHQVHGADVAVVRGPRDGVLPMHHADGLMTDHPGTVVGIHVADCGPVYLVDPVRRAIALLHSGKKGSEQNITGRAIQEMKAAFGTEPSDLIVQVGPCIRPPAYEVDFASWIRDGALAEGVRPDQFHDCGACTHANEDRYYSYRRDKGNTGRMLALLGLANEESITSSP